jgi:hypothetical protein
MNSSWSNLLLGKTLGTKVVSDVGNQLKKIFQLLYLDYRNERYLRPGELEVIQEDVKSLVAQRERLAAIAALERAKEQHRETCGATYPDNMRDNCKYEDIVNQLIEQYREDK